LGPKLWIQPAIIGKPGYDGNIFNGERSDIWVCPIIIIIRYTPQIAWNWGNLHFSIGTTGMGTVPYFWTTPIFGQMLFMAKLVGGYAGICRVYLHLDAFNSSYSWGSTL
jgi:hypothetical protein